MGRGPTGRRAKRPLAVADVHGSLGNEHRWIPITVVMSAARRSQIRTASSTACLWLGRARGDDAPTLSEASRSMFSAIDCANSAMPTVTVVRWSPGTVCCSIVRGMLMPEDRLPGVGDLRLFRRPEEGDLSAILLGPVATHGPAEDTHVVLEQRVGRWEHPAEPGLDRQQGPEVRDPLVVRPGETIQVAERMTGPEKKLGPRRSPSRPRAATASQTILSRLRCAGTDGLTRPRNSTCSPSSSSWRAIS